MNIHSENSQVQNKIAIQKNGCDFTMISKGAGGWIILCRRQKNKPEKSGLCSDVANNSNFDTKSVLANPLYRY